jgi:hypothetical protein
MQAELSGDLNDKLCLKFAAEMIDVIARVKKNRKPMAESSMVAQRAEDVQYFIRNSALKEFFQKCHENMRIYVPLSVGQHYHEGEHASSQVAVLHNISEGYERWLQAKISEHTDTVNQVRLMWPVVLIIADSSQALNVLPSVEIDASEFNSQCMAILQNESLLQYEASYCEKGSQLEALYENLISAPRQHEKDVRVDLKIKKTSLRWSILKRHYQDPIFSQMINYLEQCFKRGVKVLDDKLSSNAKLSKELTKMSDNGVFKQWADRVKVNDIAYVISEIVMIHYIIFNDKQIQGEKEHAFLMYPGPLDILLGVGKNILALKFCKFLSKNPCTFLRGEMIDKNDPTQDKNTQLFSGKLIQDRSRVLPDDYVNRERLRLISSEVTEAVSLKFALSAFQGYVKCKYEKEARATKRKKEHFDEGPFGRFINEFAIHYEQYYRVIHHMCGLKLLTWDPADPIKAMAQFCNVFLIANENSQADALPRDELSSQSAMHLKTKLNCLQTKYFSHTTEAKRSKCLRSAACNLVECAVTFQRNFASLGLQLKRSKSLPTETLAKTLYGLLSVSADNSQGSQPVQLGGVAVLRPSAAERFIAGILFFIHHITKAGIDISLLSEPKYYPDDNPQVNYESSESQSGSVPEGYSLSQSK